MKHGLAACAACLLLFAPRPAPALELGAPETRSALHEPLDARIPLHGVGSGDLEGLKVSLGSPAQFELAGMARPAHLNLLEFIVVDQGDGAGFIQIRTDEPVIEPSLTFLVDVDWPRGRTVRGYKLRLASAGGSATGALRNRPASQQAERRPATGASSASTPASPSASSRGDYGPVRASETLWSIAARLRPDNTVSVQRMMLAILEANPEAFVIRNVNALRAGATLRIPTRDEIGRGDPKAAVAEVQRQHSAWARHRQRPPAVAPPPTPAPAPPAPSPRDPESDGRVEVVSPETATDVAGRTEEADIKALREELALAMEEAKAVRRELDEFRQRLAEAEDHVRELNRLVDLKNQEIMALRAETESKPAPEPVDPGTKPVAAPSEEDSEPVAAPSEEDSEPVAAPVEAESKSLPFGLGALPVNPVFLVGGAGLLLILLGVVALLRRRRASAGEDDTPTSVDSAPPEEENLLHELEAVAADLADEIDDRPGRRSQAAAPAGGMKPGTLKSEAGSSGSEALGEERMTELWQDGRAADSARLAETGTDGGAAGSSFDIRALAGDDSESSRRGGRVSTDPESGTAGAVKEGAESKPDAAADGRVDSEPGPDDGSGRSRVAPYMQDAPSDDGGVGTHPFDDIGEDEVQTKIDLAQVYMEMGDTEKAREFLEAVLTEGNTSQREAARDMLTKLD